MKKEIFVDFTNGNDKNDGSFNKPLKSLDKIKLESGMTVNLLDGIHYLSEPVCMESLKDIVFKSENNAIITSVKKINPKEFKKVSGREYFAADLSKYGSPKFNDLFVNGKLVYRAKSEDYTLMQTIPDEKNRKNPKNYKGLYIDSGIFEADTDNLYPVEFNIKVEWELHMAHAESIDYKDTLTVDGKKLVLLKFHDDEFRDFVMRYHRILSLKNRKYYFKNHIQFLKKEGEYVYDHTSGMLYYYPRKNEKIENLEFSYPVTDTLISMKDCENISFSGITFLGTTHFKMCDGNYPAGQANTMAFAGDCGEHLKMAAILSSNGKNITVQNCKFDMIGTNGILMTDSNKNIKILNNEMKNISMSAIVIGNTLTEWNDKTKNTDINIENNTISHIGYEFPTSAAVFVSTSERLNILNNTVSDTSYSAISCGWGWDMVEYGYGESVNLKDAEIAYNKISNYMQVLRDGAAIYVVGANCHVDYTKYFNIMHDNYAFISDGGSKQRGYYLDGSSSNWHVYDNVAVGTKMPIFAQFHAKTEFTHNCLVENIYTTHEIDSGNNSPERNTVIKNCFVCENEEQLLKKFKKAAKIKANAGVRI